MCARVRERVCVCVCMFGTITCVYVFVTGRSTNVPCLSSSLTMHNYGTDLHSAIIHAYHYGRFNGSSENAVVSKVHVHTSHHPHTLLLITAAIERQAVNF